MTVEMAFNDSFFRIFHTLELIHGYWKIGEYFINFEQLLIVLNFITFIKRDFWYMFDPYHITNYQFWFGAGKIIKIFLSFSPILGCVDLLFHAILGVVPIEERTALLYLLIMVQLTFNISQFCLRPSICIIDFWLINWIFRWKIYEMMIMVERLWYYFHYTTFLLKWTPLLHPSRYF